MLDLRPALNLLGNTLHAVPLLVLYLTDGCNSRCITCDIWRAPRRNMPLELAQQLAADSRVVGLKHVLFSGGEAMQHPHWSEIAGYFKAQGVSVGLLTNGLLLKKQAALVRQYVDTLTVSLDGATRETYQHIRGVDGLDLILNGMRAVAEHVPITTRTTLQRANFREMPQIVDVALAAGARKVSFLAVDVATTEAFGARPAENLLSPALSAEDLPSFAAILTALEQTHAVHFATGQIAESPIKLRRLYDYFAALHGMGEFPAPQCNAPHLSAVIGVDGTIRPCYFLPDGGKIGSDGLLAALNNLAMRDLRRAYRHGQRRECARCVCPLYRSGKSLLTSGL
ncbi:MAG: hypothetical protein OHK0023_07520 [Anaerolineae bacterium]